MRAGGEDARVVRSAEHDANSAPLALRQKFRQSALVQERIPACEQDEIEIDVLERIDAHAPIVHAEAVTRDRSLALELGERRYRAVHRVAKALGLRVAVRSTVDVVDVDDVEPRYAEPLQAVVDRASRPVVGVVVALAEREHADVAVLVARRVPVRNQETADLARERIVAARDVAQRSADAVLRETVAVM